jgi:hypothetical protein
MKEGKEERKKSKRVSSEKNLLSGQIFTAERERASDKGKKKMRNLCPST